MGIVDRAGHVPESLPTMELLKSLTAS
jgi:hypothetical protein